MRSSVEDLTLQALCARKKKKKLFDVYSEAETVHRAENQEVVRLVSIALEFGLL